MCLTLFSEYPFLKAEILSAPNRYRKMSDAEALAMQRCEWPEKANLARGKDVCFMCWDEILVWGRA